MFLACALVAVPVYFALGTISTTSLYDRHTFYVILELSSYTVIGFSLLMLILKFLMFKKSLDLQDCVFVFYRNMDRWGSAWVGLGIGAILGLEYFVMPLLNRAVSSSLSFSLLLNIVPIDPVGLPAALAWVPQPLSNLVQQLLWQVLSIGHSEEMFKVALIFVGVAIFGWGSENEWFPGWKIGVIMFVSDVVWACAHAMVAYGGDTSAILMAVIAGLVFLIQLIATKSVLVPITTHGIVNVILTLGTMGFTWATLTGGAVSMLAATAAVVLAFL